MEKMEEHSLQNNWAKLARGSSLLRQAMKGGKIKMDIKSRYEVIADLEEKKRSLIVQRDNLDKNLKMLERELKELRRNIEDKQEEIANYKESMKVDKATTTELIKSVDASLDRLTKISKDK